MKRFIAAALIMLLLVCLTSALATTPGSAADPLISLSYINNTLIPSVLNDCKSLTSNSIGKLYGSTEEQIRGAYEAYILRLSGYSGYTFAADFTQLSIPAGSKTELVTGSTFILTSGSTTLHINNGTVINITTGEEVTSGAALTTNQRYFCAEDTSAVFTAINGSTCQVDGYYKTTGTVIVNTNKFLDVSNSDWFYDAVVFSSENGLFTGTSESAFSPNSSMTRAMFVTVLYRLDGKSAVSSAPVFPDVSSKKLYYYNAVAWANANNIVNGFDDGKFYPDTPITREQMAVIMYRYASYAGCKTAAGDTSKYYSFPDSNKVSAFAADAMKWSTSNSLINGSDGKLLPQDTASRAQVAQIILNFCRNIIGM